MKYLSFENLYQKEYTLLSSYTQQLLSSKEDAQDLVQDTFTNFLISHPTPPYSNDDLYTIYFDLLQQHRLKIYTEIPYLPQLLLPTELTLYERDLQLSFQNKARSALRTAFSRLSPSDQKLLLLSYVYKKTCVEISTLLSISKPTYRKRLERSRRRLIKHFTFCYSNDF